MSEIWAKSNGILLKAHVSDILESIEKIDFKRLKIKMESISIDEFKKLLKYAIFFHDLGKVSPVFQKKRGNHEFEPQIYFPDVRHNILSLFFINKEKIKNLCEGKENLYATLLSAIAFHHWKKDEKEYLLHINDNLIKASEILLEEKNGKSIGEILAENLINHFRDFDFKRLLYNEKPEDLISFDKDLAMHIKKEGNLISTDIIPPYSLYFLPEKLRAKYEKGIDLKLWIFLSGFLIRTDHFVSFVEGKETPKFKIEDVEKPAREIRVIERLKREKNLKDEDLWQKNIVEKYKDDKDRYKDRNLILIAPTGIGKTEFAFAWAEGEKFFYTLPLRVATNQIFERACRYFNEENKKDEEDPFMKENVGLLHSDADLYLMEKAETSEEDIDGETLRILELSKYFSLPVNICTGDQIFPASLKYPQYEKIYATLGYSKLIIDEVQAYDPKACAIVVKMIEDIVSLGGKFLLMTATLPEFVKKYFQDKEIINEEDIIDCYNKLEIKIDYRHKIELREKDILDDIEEIISKAKEDKKRVLIVLNTIEKAEEVFEKIKNNQDIFIDLLHSRFTLNQRKEKEKKLEKEFQNPKSEYENIPKILVATQVVEASLDIDADYLFTEIAPIDSLVQRMGRVMRRVDLLSGKIKNSEKEFKYERYYKDREPNVVIYYQKKEDKKNKKDIIIESGKGHVYSGELLRKTYEILENKSELKENEKQKLVEELYSNLENSEYIKEFYKTISILESGYVSENKEEAHRIFREIYTMPLIKEEDVEKIKEKIKNQEEVTWLWFKKEIIAEYVINDYLKYERKVESLWKKLSESLKLDKGLSDKIERYSKGIWIYKEK